jgi:EmrB/QacA subfamily drug resistance transporter
MSNNKIIAVLFVGVLMGALDISIVGPAIPSIEQTIKIDPSMISWIFTMYILFNLLGISLFAKLSDIYGRSRIYAICIAIFGAGSLVVALSDNYTLILVGRAIQGYGASGIFPVASAVIGDIFPPEKRGRMLGLIGAVFGLAFIMGPLIAGILLTFTEWHVLFLINIPIAVVLIYYALRILPRKKISEKTKIDWLGILTLGSALAFLTLGISRIDTRNYPGSFENWRIWCLFILSFSFFAINIYHELRTPEPILNLRYFKSRQIRNAGLLALGTGFFQAFFIFLPKLSVAAFHLTPAKASFMILPLVFASAIGSPLFGRLIDKLGTRKVIMSGLVFLTIGMIIGMTETTSKPMFFIAGILTGIAFSILSGPALRYILLNETLSTERASSQAIITIFISVGQIINATIIGGIIAGSSDPIKGYQTAFGYLSIVSVILFLVSLRLKNREEELRTATR